MSPPKQGAATTRPSGPTYRPPQRPIPSSQLPTPSSQPRPQLQHPRPVQPQLTFSEYPPRSETPLVACDESFPQAQPQSQYMSSSQYRPASAMGRPSQVNDSYRSNTYSGELVPATPTPNAGMMRPSPAQQMQQAQMRQQQTQQQVAPQQQQGARGQTASDKITTSVRQLEERIVSMQDEVRALRDSTHDVRTSLQAVPTREEMKEELRDMLSPALYEFYGNITASFKETVSPISEQTAQLAADKIRAGGFGASQGYGTQSSDTATVSRLIDHLISSLRPIDELKDSIRNIKDLPEALQSVAIFHRSMELLHKKVDQVKDSQEIVAEVSPTQRRQGGDLSSDILRTVHRMEEKMEAMETRLASMPLHRDMLNTMQRFSDDVAFFRASHSRPHHDQSGYTLHPPSRTNSSGPKLDMLADAAALANQTSLPPRSGFRRVISYPAEHPDSRRNSSGYALPPAWADPLSSPVLNRGTPLPFQYQPQYADPNFHPARYPSQTTPVMPHNGRTRTNEPETLYDHAALHVADAMPSGTPPTSSSSSSIVPLLTPATGRSSEEPAAPPGAPKPKRIYARKKPAQRTISSDPPPTPPSTEGQDVFGEVVPVAAKQTRKRKAAPKSTPSDEQPSPQKKGRATTQAKKAPAKSKKAPAPKKAPAAKKTTAPKKAPAKRATTTKKAPAKRPSPPPSPPPRSQTPVPRELIELLDDSLNSISDSPQLGKTRSETRRSREASATSATGQDDAEEGEWDEAALDELDGDALIGLDW